MGGRGQASLESPREPGYCSCQGEEDRGKPRVTSGVTGKETHLTKELEEYRRGGERAVRVGLYTGRQAALSARELKNKCPKRQYF